MNGQLKELCLYTKLKIDGVHFDGLVLSCTWNVHISILYTDMKFTK